MTFLPSLISFLSSGNCSVHPLSVSSVRMKHVGELLDFAAREVQFVYSGKVGHSGHD